MTRTYTVFVGGSEVNDYLLTYDDALDIANYWREQGYDDVHIVGIEQATV
jgi:hypothetical protein